MKTEAEIRDTLSKADAASDRALALHEANNDRRLPQYKYWLTATVGTDSIVRALLWTIGEYETFNPLRLDPPTDEQLQAEREEIGRCEKCREYGA